MCWMTLEEFAVTNGLPENWIKLRRECERIVRDPQFWSRTELQSLARGFAQEASDLLQHARNSIPACLPKRDSSSDVDQGARSLR